MMSRLEIPTPGQAQLVIEDLYKDLERRIESSPPGLCHVDMTRAFLELCHAQTCGKCVPCRVGLWQLKTMLTDVLNGEAELDSLDDAVSLLRMVKNLQECDVRNLLFGQNSQDSFFS